MLFNYLKGSCIFAVLMLLVASGLGYYEAGMLAALSALWTAVCLGVMETTLSVDNAVVNASILKNMNAFWKKMFLTIGMFVAVFGMRIFLPLVIVAVSDDISLYDALILASTDPVKYEHIMEGCHLDIMGFGAVFLLTVFLNHFTSAEQGDGWLSIEHYMSLETVHPALRFAINTVIVGAVCIGVAHFIDPAKQEGFLHSCAAGYGVFVLLEAIKYGIGSIGGGSGNIAIVAARYGIVGFVYLEILDASFSVDGVVAAFALTNNFWIIASGLAIGAGFVRSFTLYMTDNGTLDQYQYLEPAAFWAIGFLVFSMFMSAVGIELGEAIIGLGSIGIISAGVYASIKQKKIESPI